ncbi:PD-(D/E)XK motif protein [Hyphomicrobium sp. 1Nfss2.1]|uniref:PD-(D/E)XK motif protein n=1 Tax=Hyphomicrobium sp. 1Nfss2.1 TaxID=3413936 RepID=UPI003C7EB922
MTRWLDALTVAWDELARTPPIARQYRSRVISAETPLEIRAGIRAMDDAPCLMLYTALPPDALFELGGMRLNSVPDDSGPLLVLSLEDAARRDLFTTICADVVAAASQPDQNAALTQFLARLDAWRQFLRDRRDGLSRAETVGLIGELLILERLIEADADCLASWQAPLDGLHDFQRDGHDLEVKTGLGPASTITISRLDQLDTSGVRRLDLLHVRLIESPAGRSLRDIIADLSAALPDEARRSSFENLLLRRGLLPGDDVARNAPRVQIRTIDGYVVADGFPRLVRSGLPIAITDATYTLEVRGISTFAEDATATLDAFHQGAR